MGNDLFVVHLAKQRQTRIIQSNGMALSLLLFSSSFASIIRMKSETDFILYIFFSPRSLSLALSLSIYLCLSLSIFIHIHFCNSKWLLMWQVGNASQGTHTNMEESFIDADISVMIGVISNEPNERTYAIKANHFVISTVAAVVLSSSSSSLWFHFCSSSLISLFLVGLLLKIARLSNSIFIECSQLAINIKVHYKCESPHSTIRLFDCIKGCLI